MSPAALLFVALAAPVLAAQSPPLFQGADIVTGNKPRHVAVTDLNLDGRSDLVISYWFQSLPAAQVTVLLGNGIGGFASSKDYPLPDATLGLAVADLNNDGRPDVVTQNLSVGGIAVLLGDGQGGLGAATTVVPTISFRALAVGDMNHDGNLDIVGTSGSNQFVVSLGNGLGGFGAPSASIYNSAGSTSGLSLGDFDGDGNIDVVYFAFSFIGVVHGHGNGTLGTVKGYTVAVAITPGPAVVADLNEDGRADLMVTNTTPTSGMSALLSGGPGDLADPVNVTIPENSTSALVAGQLNGDGHVDLAWSNSVSGHVIVGFGNGAGSYSSTTTFQSGYALVGFDHPTTTAAGDFNGDGRADLITANDIATDYFTPDDVSIAFGDGQGGFFPALPAPSGASPIAVDAADLNGDGVIDLVALDSPTVGAGAAAVMLGTGGGFHSAPSTFAVGTGPSSMALGDLNGDGKSDLLATIPGANALSILLWTGGGFGAATSISSGGTSPQSVAVGDLNGDGKLDAVVANATSNQIAAMLGNGAGAFGAPATTTVGASPRAVALADLNGDGKLDLLVAVSGTGSVASLLGNGLGGFGAPVPLVIGNQPVSVVICDVNEDGKIDYVAADPSINSALVRVGDGAGGFTFVPGSASIGFGAGLASVALGDFDGDGHVDVAASLSPNVVRTAPGDGTAHFPPKTTFIVGSQPRGLAAADLNADGWLDLVVAEFGSNAVAPLLNQSPPRAGLSVYGTGTQGFNGREGMNATTSPKVNSPGLKLICTQAPPRSLGLGLIANVQDLAGSDPFGFGIKLHVDLFASTLVTSLNFTSDVLGYGLAPAPIPNNPSIAGATLFAQSIWAWPASQPTPSPLHLSSSKGLKLALQP